jgi:ComF family protein
VLLAVTCPVCGERGPAPCADCRARLRPAPALPPPPGVDDCRALLAYVDAGRDVVARLKHRNHRAALTGLASAAATLVAPAEVDVVTWTPTTPDRRRARGFDQSELIARAVARRLGRPTRRYLSRANGPAQTGRSAAERWAGASFSLRFPPPPDSRVLLVDDVVTTGATVAAAARCLRGGTEGLVIVVLALARTPLKAATVRDDH